MDENFMTRTQLEMAEGRRRLKEMQGQLAAEQTLGERMLQASSLAPATNSGEQFDVVDLPAVPSRKKKKTESNEKFEVDELLASLKVPETDDDRD